MSIFLDNLLRKLLRDLNWEKRNPWGDSFGVPYDTASEISSKDIDSKRKLTKSKKKVLYVNSYNPVEIIIFIFYKL